MTNKLSSIRVVLGSAVLAASASVVTMSAQSGTPPKPPQQTQATPAPNGTAAPVPPAAAPLPTDYVIGPDDVLAVVFWRDKDISAETVVRPDGKISLPLINEIQAAGLTPEQLRLKVTEEAAKLMEGPTVWVVVKQINSRKVFIIGEVGKPGVYPLNAPTTVLQLITIAGGLQDWADKKNIFIVRGQEKRPDGEPVSYRFNYEEYSLRRNLKQNIELKPGDQIIVR